MGIAPDRNAQTLIPFGAHGGISIIEGREGATLIVQALVEGTLRRFTTRLTSEQTEKLKGFQVETSASPVTHEVERKWCVSDPSHLASLTRLEASAAKVSRIQQGYLCAGRDEARLRQKNDEYFLTLKSSGGLIRTEAEVALTEAQFNELWIATEGRRLEKTRSVVSLENGSGESVRVEVDRFHGSCSSLVLVEIEFASISRATEFIAPSFFGVEVTEDANYKNKSLACVGLPSTLLSAITPPRVV